jgi:hypothetical protein
MSKIIKKDESPSAEGRVNQSRSGSSRTIVVEKRAHSKSQEPKSSLKRVFRHLPPLKRPLQIDAFQQTAREKLEQAEKRPRLRMRRMRRKTKTI